MLSLRGTMRNHPPERYQSAGRNFGQASGNRSPPCM